MQNTVHPNRSVRMNSRLTLFWYLLFGVCSSAKVGNGEGGEGFVKTLYGNMVLVSPVKRVSGHHYLGKIATSKVKG